MPILWPAFIRVIMRMGVVYAILSVSLSAVVAKAHSRCSDWIHLAAGYEQNPARSLAKLLEPGFSHLQVNRAKIEAFARHLHDRGVRLTLPPWNWPPYLEKSQDFEDVFAYFLTINSINYKFFHSGTEKKFSNQGVSGATLMALRVAERWNDLKADGFRLLRHADERLLSDLFRADVSIPMIPSRVLAFRELGYFLEQYHKPEQGIWLNTLKEIESPAAAAYGLTYLLPSWKDPFLKRAQLQMFMALGRASALGVSWAGGSHPDVNDLTVAADYVLPQVLIALGIIVPSSNLERRIVNRIPISSGTPIELELRAATIVATEYLRDCLSNPAQPVPIGAIDAFLWTVGRSSLSDQALLESIRALYVRPLPPYHQTETTDY